MLEVTVNVWGIMLMKEFHADGADHRRRKDFKSGGAQWW